LALTQSVRVQAGGAGCFLVDHWTLPPRRHRRRRWTAPIVCASRGRVRRYSTFGQRGCKENAQRMHREGPLSRIDNAKRRHDAEKDEPSGGESSGQRRGSAAVAAWRRRRWQQPQARGRGIVSGSGGAQRRRGRWRRGWRWRAGRARASCARSEPPFEPCGAFLLVGGELGHDAQQRTGLTKASMLAAATCAPAR